MKLIYKSISLFTLFFLLLVGCNGQSTSNEVSKEQQGKVFRISPTEFQQKSENKLILDIRTPYEFNQGHLKGAININLYDKSFMEKVSAYDKEQPLFIYCRSGSRTSSAAKKLAKAGFKEVYDMQGGIINWSRNNLSIIK